MRKKLIYILLLIISFLFQGCSTVTQQTVNQVPGQLSAQVSPVLKMSEYKGLKRIVAISRFTNETRYGASFLLDDNNDRIGKQASDILSARLTETGKFLMVERSDIDKIKSELKEFKLDSNLVSSDYLIIGSVSEFGRKDTSDVGVFSRNKKQTVTAKVNVRLVEVKTGRIIYSEEGSGQAETEANSVFGVGVKAGYDATLDDKALSAAISKLVSNIVENLMDKPWQSRFLSEQDGLYIIAGGTSQGIKEGDIFNIKLEGNKVKNPQTGSLIHLPGRTVGTLKVERISGKGDDEVSFCSIISGSVSNSKLSKYVIEESSK